MESKVHYENKSLLFLCGILNNEYYMNFENFDSLQIISKNKPGFVIKQADIEISDYMFSLPEILKTGIKKIESNFFDFIVYKETKDENNELIISIFSLFELIISSQYLSEQMDNNIWDLNSEEWNLIEIIN